MEKDWTAGFAARFPHVTIKLTRRTYCVTLDKLIVARKQRDQTIGTRVMLALIDEADAHGDTLALTPTADYGASSATRLTSFYRRFGFRINGGRDRDFRFNDSMVRKPRTTKGDESA